MKGLSRIKKIPIRGRERDTDPTSRERSHEQTRSCKHIPGNIEGHLLGHDLGPSNEAGVLANSKKRGIREQERDYFQRKKREERSWLEAREKIREVFTKQ